ncbi:MAG: hypothetical protein CMK09_00865 [Ponticaulis sp.]|nr:hypothetical protein [Ponticaulis sp.]
MSERSRKIFGPRFVVEDEGDIDRDRIKARAKTPIENRKSVDLRKAREKFGDATWDRVKPNILEAADQLKSGPK